MVLGFIVGVVVFGGMLAIAVLGLMKSSRDAERINSEGRIMQPHGVPQTRAGGMPPSAPGLPSGEL